MPQSTYSVFMEPGQEGQIATLDTYLRSGQVGTFCECVNSLSEYLPFGRVVVAKPSGKPGELQLPTANATTQPPLGLSYIMTYEKDLDGTSGVPPKRPIGYVYEGVVWVRTESAIAAEAQVFYRITANGANTELGRIRGDADGGNAVALPRAKAVRAAAAGQMVPVRVDIPLVPVA